MTRSHIDFEFVKCNICQSTDTFPIISTVENNSKLYLVICKNCGLAFLNPRWTKDEYKKYYEAEYDAQYRPRLASGVSTEDSSKLNIVLERFREAQLLPNRPIRILDIGSGDGITLIDFNKAIKGCQLFAIEPSLIACEILRKKDVRIISHDVDSAWDENIKDFFDIIILRHVLEHFLDPSSVLRKVYAALNDQGVTYIAVPDNLVLNRTEGWLRIAHTYYFNRFSLKNILNKEGFNVLSFHEGDKYNSLEIFAFANKSDKRKAVELSTEHFMLQKKVFDKVLKKKNGAFQSLTRTFTRFIPIFKKEAISHKKPQSDIPQILFRFQNRKAPAISHVSAFNYGNAGDILLPIVLRDLWHEQQEEIKWVNQPVYPIVDDELVARINHTQGVVVGGGGLFLKDTNPNNISGWQWPCSIEMLNKLNVPLVLFAVGYNRFRGQDEFDAVFTENIRAFAEKSVYLGIRNHGSIEALKKYLPAHLHNKLVFQPCMTTLIKRLYPDVANYSLKENFFALNSAFDRSHLRFGHNIGQILNDIAVVCKEISKQLPLKFYSHMPSDQAILPFLQAYDVRYELVDLQRVHPRQIIELYARPKFVLGMRGHAQMIPFGCNTPIVSIISHNKLQWFLEDIGQPEWGADVISRNFRNELLHRSLNVLDNYQSIMKYIDEKQEMFYNTSLKNTKVALDAMLNKDLNI